MVPLATVESTVTPTSPDDPTTPTNSRPSIVDTSKGYSSVNKLSLLPDDVRTASNLEAGTIPTGREAELMQQYAKERADYEQRQLDKMAEMRAKRAAGDDPQQQVATGTIVTPLSASPPQGGGYETVAPLSSSVARGGTDPYEDPADAVASVKKDAIKKSPVQPAKKMSVGIGGGVGEEYTPVFNTLPKGQVEKIHTQAGKSGRSMSDSASPTAKSPHSTKPTSFTVSYENSPSPSKSGASPAHVHKPPASNESSPEEMRRQDSTRLSSRKPAKEVVEFDPSKPRKFRVTSAAKRNEQRIEEVDGGSGEREASAAAPRTKSFSVQATVGTEDKGQLSYALVNMVDKKKRRSEQDMIKVEGSGIPQHVMVPIATTS